ncbi:laminin subunit gamma-1 [Amyelois transitella]|uniref:laminin subunit gamma-1 n=1 Tax=Amyelois transitella TaxID=680683 RepID=UPI00299024D5|nr:laminin subunit gamma-1 [Amyelois transitella]
MPCPGRSAEMAPLFILIILTLYQIANAQDYYHTPRIGTQKLALCYASDGRPQRCIPEFENAAFMVQMEATNTCGENGPKMYCIQTSAGTSTRSCDYCQPGQFSSYFLTDLHHEQNNQTWWQSETMMENRQHHPYQVNLTLHLGKAYDITYVRIVFYSPRPQSFAIYKKTSEDRDWEPFQYFSASCRDTYGVNEQRSAEINDETRALCTSEYSDISPLTGGNVLFSTLEGRPSAYTFDSSPELQEWVTATDLRISLERLNTFGDEIFDDAQVLQSYWYAIADVFVGARCKCNGHASVCDTQELPDGTRRRFCRCEHNTAGRECEKCLDFYNDAPWGRASSTNVHECKACNCNGYSDKCYFDQELYEQSGHGGHCMDCAENRDGPNCERCRENYYQGERDICLPCNCDTVGSRSLQCNAEGRCPCKPGVTGDKCDVCAANHYDFTAQGCKPCDCYEPGSFNNSPQCHPVTGVCVCKQNVEGRRCRECKPGFFNLDLNNEFGCTPCFCFGHSSQCSSAPKYQAHEISAHYIRDAEKWTAEDERSNPAELRFNANTQNIAVQARGQEVVYFVASNNFLGDQRPSYNHDLKFTLRLGEARGYPSSQDIILEGARTSVSMNIYGQSNPEPSDQAQEYTFRLHEDPKYGWTPTLSNFEFMSILQNLTAIKVRGTYNKGGTGYLMNFKLETAKVGRERGSAPANWVEKCTCPSAYVGDYCEECAPGYKHEPANGGPYSTCIPCDCNGHAHICDTATGFCICKHNTTGSNCELCAKGFYGNAIAGTPDDCKPCPCPEDSGCIQLMDNSIVCTDCPVGYAGPRCEVCADGHFGDPTGQFGPPTKCTECQCNGNVDPNAVGNCNRTTGECLKCIYNTAGDHCDKCLSGFFGDALDPKKKGDCKPCQCLEAGTVESPEGPPQCDGLTGYCSCRPHVIGRNCDKCEDGYYNIFSGEGCKACDCNLEGSFNSSCHPLTGQCYCKPGIDGIHCDSCKQYHYGFSPEGCQDCDCDDWGSNTYQCDMSGQCSCQENVEGRRCDRCMENKRRRGDGFGCEDCPPCYNLVLDAVNQHRKELKELDDILSKISKAPTVVENADFDKELARVRAEIDALSRDAQSEAGDGSGETLTDTLTELSNRLADIKNMLRKIEDESYDGKEAVEESRASLSKAEDTIEAAGKEINSALEYLDGEGAAAFNKARDRSDQFGKQSGEMSKLAKESRLLAEKLEAEAKNIREIAEKAFNTSLSANKIAKDGINKQANISNEIQILTTELNAASGKLNSMVELADQALARAKDVYDEALGLYAEVNTTMLPDINIEKLKQEAAAMNKTIEEKSADLDRLITNNEDVLKNLEDAVRRGKELLDHGHDRQDELNDLLAKLDELHAQAKHDVELTNATLKEANEIYKTLKEFTDQVEQSRQKATQAVQDVPSIQEKLAAAEESINFITEELYTAGEKAKDARDLAQEAQKEYADKASEAAHEIKKKASLARVDAVRLRDEADKLSTRVQGTEQQLKNLELDAAENMKLTHDAKTKVGQANTDAREAEKQVSKGLEDLKVIMDELNNLPTLDDKALDKLKESLDRAEAALMAEDLEGKIKSLTEAKNNHQRWMKQYQDEHDHLRLEVDNVRDILEQLPNGCFKRIELEPTEGPSLSASPR